MPSFRKLSPKNFVKAVSGGYDASAVRADRRQFPFLGITRAGDANSLADLGAQVGFEVAIVPPVVEEGSVVLKHGDPPCACAMAMSNKPHECSGVPFRSREKSGLARGKGGSSWCRH